MNNRKYIKLVEPGSDKQIQTILRENRSLTYYKLCILIAKFIKKYNYYDFLYHLLKNRRPLDSAIFTKIKPIMKPAMREDEHYLSKLAGPHATLIESRLSRNNITSYLDVGCGKCELTAYIGKAIGLSSNNIYGTDVKQEFEASWGDIRRKNNMLKFEYITSSGEIPFGGEQFDIITCFMVLHHIQKPEDTIKQIFERLRPGGLFYIREHNCETPQDHIFADLVHSLYILQNNELWPSLENIRAQHNYYKSAKDWRQLLCSVGFKEVYFFSDTFSISNNYKAIYKK